MADKEEMSIIKEIAKKYGSIINLNEAPSVLAEIVRNYGGRFVGGKFVDATCPPGSGSSQPPGVGVGGGTGGVMGSGSSGSTSGPIIGEAGLSDIMRGVLQLQRAVSGIDLQLKGISIELGNLTLDRSTHAAASARDKARSKVEPSVATKAKRKRS